MSVWFCIPSKRPPEEAEPILKLWRERGYKIALFTDSFADADAKTCDMHVSNIVYSGYASAVNRLIRGVLVLHPDVEWIVCGGDDVQPDPNHTAEEIARECSKHFWEAWLYAANLTTPHMEKRVSTFGVMQPTGDRWGDGQDRPWTKPGSAYVDRVAGSPWMGREFCRRMYGGTGPLCELYYHMGEDEELQAVAKKLGVFWQRQDLTHFHAHWARPRSDPADRPAFLDRANSGAEWAAYKKLFEERAAAGFPGHEPLLGA